MLYLLSYCNNFKHNRAIIILVFGGVIFNFFLFHLDLVSTNKTTIDTLEVRRNGNPSQTPLNVYDIG